VSPLHPWRRIGDERLVRSPVFSVDRVRFAPPGSGTPRDFYRISAPDWVNVIPLTDRDEVLFVRQFRFGVEGFTLEIPGGVCDENEPPRDTARRELREETGYTAREIVELGSVHPNPALQANRCHCYLARGLERAGDPAPDEVEAFELVALPLAEVGPRIARGEITHALVVAAFQLLAARA
jgi:8-oxo-dGTP pyrophosphatase MutT (NUDIX family)